MHLPGHGEASVAAWVCLVAPYSAQPLLKTYCRHPLLNGHEQLPAVNQAKASGAGGASKGHQLRGIGGVRLKALQGAPSLSQVADQVRELWHGRLLVGHGVAKDLKALGVDVELSDCSNDTTGSASSGVYYDTITFPEFQSKVSLVGSLAQERCLPVPAIQPKEHLCTSQATSHWTQGGTAYSLKRLAKERLGQNIHAPGALHDPEVDARVVLRLYMEVVRPTLLSSSYDDLVQHYEQQFLAQAMARQGKPQDEQASPEA